MAAFEYAVFNGADGIELDVMLTKDNHVVVFHDGYIDRVLDGSGNVSEMTLQQLQSIPYRIPVEESKDQPIAAASSFCVSLGERVIDMRKERVPLLETIIQFVLAHNIKLMIEFKEVRRPDLLRRYVGELYRKYQLHDRAFIASFHPWHIYQFRRSFPDIPASLLYCKDMLEWYHEEKSEEMRLPRFIDFRWLRWALDLSFEHLSPTLYASWLGVSMVGAHDILLSANVVRDNDQRKYVTNAWTVNTSAAAAYLRSIGVLVTTDKIFPKLVERQ